MITKADKNSIRRKRHKHVRRTVRGTAERPRLNVFRSSKHIYAQLIDDEQQVTLASASTLEKEAGVENGGNVEAAKKVGEAIAQRALEKGLDTVVFDRGGYLYHGRVKALADAAREAGLRF
ncbi:MAG TPA: 50S ribosomal protein L18 [Bacillales bacterium]|nr:50S ribosomal protein L18 [Bacillales bacterium]